MGDTPGPPSRRQPSGKTWTDSTKKLNRSIHTDSMVHDRWGMRHLILQPGLLTLAELRFDAMRERGQPPSIMDGCVD